MSLKDVLSKKKQSGASGSSATPGVATKLGGLGKPSVAAMTAKKKPLAVKMPSFGGASALKSKGKTSKGRGQRTVGVTWRGSNLYIAESVVSDKGTAVLRGIRVERIPANVNAQDGSLGVFLRQKITEMCGTAKVEVWAGLPDEQADLLAYRIGKPAKAGTQRDSQCVLSAKKEKDFDDQWIFDYMLGEQVTEKGVVKTTVAGMLVNRNGAQFVRQMMIRAGLPLTGILAKASAGQNLFSSGWAGVSECVGILHIDEEYARIDLLHKGVILLTRSVRTGFSSFVREFLDSYSPNSDNPVTASTNSTPPPNEATARQMILNSVRATGEGAIPLEELLQRIGPSVERLVRQLERSINFFSNDLELPPVGNIYVSSPGGVLTFLGAEVGKQLGVSCEALSSLRGPLAPGIDVEYSRLAQQHPDVLWAVGLSMTPSDSVNALFTYVDRTKAVEAKHNLYFAAAASAVIVFLAFLYAGYEFFQTAEAEQTVAELEQTLARFGEVVDEPQLLAKVAEVTKTRTAVKSMSERQMSAALISEISSLIPAGVVLSGMTFTNSGGVVIAGHLQGDLLYRENMFAEFLYRVEHSPLVTMISSVEKKSDADSPANTLIFVLSFTLV